MSNRTGLPEPEYRERLGALIQRYDDDVTNGSDETRDGWWNAWWRLLDESSPEQEKRADDLHTLHIRNREGVWDDELADDDGDE